MMEMKDFNKEETIKVKLPAGCSGPTNCPYICDNFVDALSSPEVLEPVTLET